MFVCTAALSPAPQIAARGAFREAMGKAGARLLEPIMKVCVFESGRQGVNICSQELHLSVCCCSILGLARISHFMLVACWQLTGLAKCAIWPRRSQPCHVTHLTGFCAFRSVPCATKRPVE